MTASEQYLREIDRAIFKLHGAAPKPVPQPLSDMGQGYVAKYDPIRLPGGCLLYRLVNQNTDTKARGAED